VVDSRSSREGRAIRRRRECLGCKERFTTYEYLEEIPLMVVKRDGNREPYDRQKLLKGIVTACTKRPVTMQEMEEAVNAIEKELENLEVREVKSIEIGEKVMEKLKGLDHIAYVRFASVYRKFKDTTEFLDEIRELLDTPRHRRGFENKEQASE
jgi:transcriptional repressor NrdR